MYRTRSTSNNSRNLDFAFHANTKNKEPHISLRTLLISLFLTVHLPIQPSRLCTCGSILIVNFRADTLQMSPGLWPRIPSLPSSEIFLGLQGSSQLWCFYGIFICFSIHPCMLEIGRKASKIRGKWFATESHLQPV